MLAIVAASPAAAATCADESLTLSATNSSKVEAAIVCLVNQERAKRGRKALKISSSLTKAARAHTKDMKDRNYFAHNSPGGSTPVQRARKAGYKGHFIGENIAFGAMTAKNAVAIWMASKQHRKNILSKNYTLTGVGALSGGRTLYTQMFGSA